MTKREVGKIVSFAELRGEFDPTHSVVVTDEPDHQGPQIGIAVAYTELKLRSVLSDPEWALEMQDQILQGENPFGFFESWPMTADDIMDELL
ncbi:hypothetical protein KJ910_03860 [Patescibacteria group bacterium]|nr:hypothetical protein [Patescibacteria group bacterium]MBU1906984.1 hypothetical protein [Patescibacteria group bacterium]